MVTRVQLGGKFTDWMIEVGYIGFFWRTYSKEHTLRRQRTGTLLFVVWMLLCSVYTLVLTDFCDTNQENLSNKGKIQDFDWTLLLGSTGLVRVDIFSSQTHRVKRVDRELGNLWIPSCEDTTTHSIAYYSNDEVLKIRWLLANHSCKRYW